MKPTKASNVVTYIMGMAFNLALLAIIAYAVYHFTMRGFAEGEYFAETMLAEGPDQEVTFILEEDTPRAEVAQRLYQYEIIANPWLFRLEMFLKNSTRVYRAGTYTLNRNMTNTEVNAILRARPVVEQAGHLVVTIREGWTIAQMAAYFESREFFTAEEFIEYAETGDFHFRFIRDIPQHPERKRLEGYLFPNTYFVPLEPTPRDIIFRMLHHFEYVVEGHWYYRAYELGFTMDEIITMASIIEGETGVPGERPIVSQVIHRRLSTGTPLQMDATVVYALDVRRDRLTHADLQVQSPFNTHQFSGLPLGPIGNPGRASIEAALWPSDTNYYFFVVDADDHSRHVFSETYAEHHAAVQRYHASLN